jgi:hypothetical protein
MSGLKDFGVLDRERPRVHLRIVDCQFDTHISEVAGRESASVRCSVWPFSLAK